MQEINIHGVFIPSLALLACAAMTVLWLLEKLLTRLGFYRHVWHGPLFNLALYVVILGGCVTLYNWIFI